MEGNEGALNYPEGAARVRDMIRENLLETPQAARVSGGDTGGGFGSADLWLTVDGIEFIITVKPTGKAQTND